MFYINGWLENDRASIPHRLPRISPKLVMQMLQKLISHDGVLIRLSTNLLDNGNPSIGLGHMRLVPDKRIVKVKASILLQLYALNAIDSLQKAITESHFPRK